LIAPHGPDPVFCGIRGEDQEIVLNGLKMLKIEEKLEGYLIYRTNQGTSMHLQNKLELSNTKTYTSGFSRCKVVTNPYTIQGGHVLFIVGDDSNTCLAAVYEPTGLTTIASQLHIGDFIEIGFGVRKATSKHTKVLNIEYILVLKTVDIYEFINPSCKNCGKRMKSEGKNKGFQCKRCKTLDRYGEKVKLLKPRTIKENLYIPTAKAQRHLTKPMHRYGMEKKGWNTKNNIFLKWFEIFV
jgi:tRNA(Ile2)-agmatinylcytidine synthase